MYIVASCFVVNGVNDDHDDGFIEVRDPPPKLFLFLLIIVITTIFSLSLITIIVIIPIGTTVILLK